MADGPLLSTEEFTIRKPLFRAGILAFTLGTMGGLYLDISEGAVLFSVFDVVTLGLLAMVVAGVRWWGWQRSRGVAVLIYTGGFNFLLALVQAVVTRAPNQDVSIYNNLFILSLFLGISTFLIGRWSSLIFGAVILTVLLSVSTLWKDSWVAGNLWFEVPAVVGSSYLLYQYRGALDRLLSDLRRVIGENRTLRDRERLAALGEMTAGIAHEIKNPLNFVVNFAESSQELLNDLEALWNKPHASEEDDQEKTFLLGELRQNLDDIRTQGLRGASTVQSMLLQARLGTGDLQAVDLNDLAIECLRLAWSGHRVQQARQVFRPSSEPVLVWGSRGDLARALLNLCTNALWSVSEKVRRDPNCIPEVTVEVGMAGTDARISVIDNGIGLSPQVRAQLFVPFFTTKPAGEGTGLGLSLVREVVVDQHGGRIDVDGSPGTGARFSIFLPVASP